jgi:hypothetical protein
MGRVGDRDRLVGVGHELAVVDADTPLVLRLEPAVVCIARAVRVAPAVQVRVDLQVSAAVRVDVIAASPRAVGARIQAVFNTIGVRVEGSGSAAGEESDEDQRKQQA